MKRLYFHLQFNISIFPFSFQIPQLLLTSAIQSTVHTICRQIIYIRIAYIHTYVCMAFPFFHLFNNGVILHSLTFLYSIHGSIFTYPSSAIYVCYAVSYYTITPIHSHSIISHHHIS